MPSSCFAHAPQTSSTTASAGAVRLEAPFWSQADVSQSAASAAGSVPPVTQPKKRPLVDPRMPPSVSRTRSPMTCSAAVDASGNGLARRERNSSSEAVVASGRESLDSRYRFACAAAMSSTLLTFMSSYPLFAQAALVASTRRPPHPSPMTASGGYPLRRLLSSHCRCRSGCQARHHAHASLRNEVSEEPTYEPATPHRVRWGHGGDRRAIAYGLGPTAVGSSLPGGRVCSRGAA